MKYLYLLKYEGKTIFKDAINLFLLIYPLFIVFIGGYLIPLITKKMENQNSIAITLLIMLASSLAISSFVIGSLLGFSLIENKDEGAMLNISVTPITIKGYTIFKIIYTYILSICGHFIIIGGLKLIASDAYVINYGGSIISLLDNLTWGKVIPFIFVNSLLVPTVSLIIAGFAKNKIEGFAFVKGGAIFILIPVLSLLSIFSGFKQYILGLLPNFWALKGLLNVALENNNASNLPYYGYLLIGIIYLLILNIFIFKFYLKRLNSY